MLKAGLDLIFKPKVVVAKKRGMYKEINTSFIKTKEQHNVQLKLKQAHIRVNCVSKRKVQKNEDDAEEVAQRRDWLLFQDVV